MSFLIVICKAGDLGAGPSPSLCSPRSRADWLALPRLHMNNSFPGGSSPSFPGMGSWDAQLRWGSMSTSSGNRAGLAGEAFQLVLGPGAGHSGDHHPFVCPNVPFSGQLWTCTVGRQSVTPRSLAGERETLEDFRGELVTCLTRCLAAVYPVATYFLDCYPWVS